ncbi:PucR family transcriptional regulator [Pseudomonas sp. S75]|uniref:PucR family transcriptional regulator n=1 Tax=unclassified Pseudomonas TaxID=196821 RepID=UPI001908D9D1|nr:MULTISPECIES: PucR family transcriptional regulator [unclassified Pseudomonas]MBJ9974036.1 PucR family transcriptional regulator [Pseudomonas sp. S30]MBK0152034.1 PucR family transcriptional regulator [Pseudomonas sp. S75]
MLTVEDLVAIERLQLQIAAGAGGSRRVINWAHTVELPDPWRWVSPGDLVMTTGLGLPEAAEAQVAWLRQLVQSNASALVIAPCPAAPAPSQAMLDAAELLLFPIVLASFELEFVKLSHHVIESVLQAQRERFNASERLFQTYAQALRQAPDLGGRLLILANSLNMNLALEDAVSGALLVSTAGATPALQRQGERIPIAGRVRTNLLMSRQARRNGDDSMLVRSLVGLLAVEIERLMINRDQQREESAALLHTLLDTAELKLALPMLERRGLTGTLVSLAVRTDDKGLWPVSELHHAPDFHQACPLMSVEQGLLLMICRDDPALLDVLERNLGAGTVMGISAPIAMATGVHESVRQARLALSQAEDLGRARLRYGEAELGLIMAPKSLAEARALVGRYLGPLIAHDRLQNAALLPTLTAFLRNDGSWKATAFDLGIHRQTLVYRLKLVEQLTGIKPTTTQGIARFWIALEAGRNSDLLGQP